MNRKHFRQTSAINHCLRIAISVFLCPTVVLAKNDATEPTVEIKCLLPKDKIAEFSKKIGLDSKPSFTRVVCFFDTPSLSLFEHEPKVILRSRYDSSNDTDTTVKIRNGNVQAKGAKCEYDEVLGKEKILSCSITSTKQGNKEIKRANRGKNLTKIFSKDQEAAVASIAGKIDWHELRPYGPVKGTEVWKKIIVPGGPPLTVEHWELPATAKEPASSLFEVSAKVPLSAEADTAKWMSDLVGFSANDNDQESETKTKLVLEHFKAKTPK